MEEIASEGIQPLAPPEGHIGDVMVIGAGISGIQASLDLASSGFKVYLVDEAAAIGGRMAQLDKTFPTNDCSMCILSPKLIECDRNPNIEIITNARVDRVEGEAGDFKVIVIKRPRYVDEEKCVGCGACARYCPVEVFDAFNEGLSAIKCIHIPFPQAIPAKSIIDPDECLFLTRRQCKICVPVCKNKAIDLHQKEQELEIEVGAIIVSPGYEAFDPRLKGEYGYGRIKNVITSLEFERLSSASGPYHGELLRPSDGKSPKRIAWIQCVGSRDAIIGNTYCSSVCCTYAIKQVVLAKEHDSDIEATIFYKDIRTFGKGFEQYYQMAKDMPGVRFIWGMASIVRESPETRNIVIRYCSSGSEVRDEEFDLVVLSVGLTPSPNTGELAEALHIELNPYGFCNTGVFSPGETSLMGIYASGAFRCPMDIPEAVASGSGAVSLCSQLLSGQRGALVEEKEYPPERDVSGEEPRVGVFVCRCGTNIARTVDVPSVVEYSKALDGVVHAEETIFSCSADSVRHIAETIEEKGLNRVVVAACTPRTHEPLFQETLREAGLNRYLLEMANIREQCSWVHARERDAAIQKANELVRMAVAKVRIRQPVERLLSPVTPTGLVVGGGISGMVSALSLAQQGFEVHLVEKAANLGGIANRIHFTLEGGDIHAYLEDLVDRVRRNPLIHVYTGADIVDVSGYVGNFTTRINNHSVEEIRHGITIIATGGEEYRPAEYLYRQDPRVLTLLELEEEIATGNDNITGCQSLVMIQCVGSREEERPYCSRVCCAQAIKCALKLKEINPGMEIYILYRDMMTYGFKEDYYTEAAKQGVKFIRYDSDGKPEVEVIGQDTESRLRVTVTDLILDERLAMDADVVALGVATVAPSDNEGLSHLFKVPLNQDRFFLEAHIKLRPVDFSTDGVFLCGLAHSPKFIDESISQADAAASRAATILSRREIEVPGITGQVDWDKCIGCGLCESLCPFEAIELKSVEGEDKAEIIAASCKGCGLCAPRCPKGAIRMGCFTDEQILAQVAALAA